jgi:hypothetical protein
MNEDITMLSGNLSGFSRKVREPDVYDGEKDTVILNAWIHHLKLYFSLVRIKHPQEKLLYVLSLLRKDAQLWYTQMNTFDKDHTRQYWDELKTSLRAEIIPVDGVTKARDNMKNLVQTSTVSKYINEFRRLLLATNS